MMNRVLLCCLGLCLSPLPSQAAVWDNVTNLLSRSREEQPLIKVLLTNDNPGLDITVTGRYSLFDPLDDSFISSRFKGKKKRFQACNDGLKWGEAFPGLYQIKMRADQDDVFFILNNEQFKGSLYIYDIGGTISIINEVNLEEYVRSLLGVDELNTLHSEVRAALAIVARTNGYAQIRQPKTNFWSVDGRKVGYHGVITNLHLKEVVEDAANLTKNMIISRTGIYEKTVTPFFASFGFIQPGQSSKDVIASRISLDEANEMALSGAHAAQILSKAFPQTTIMMLSK